VKDQEKVMSMKLISVELMAKDAFRGVERGDVIIVIDVLRCTSSIVTAMINGASSIIPVGSVGQARALKAKDRNYVLAGERGGLPPRGFDLGNSPRDFSTEKVRGKDIVITTTSGTQAIRNASEAKTVLIGSFLNLTSAAAQASKIALGNGRSLTIALSGKKGTFSLEDFLCAGAIISKIRSKSRLSDAASASLLAFKAADENLAKNILMGNHARELVDLGMEEDVILCSQKDKYDVVPILRNGRIVRLEST
jgi:2-phosphosulfolactate phosphatase